VQGLCQILRNGGRLSIRRLGAARHHGPHYLMPPFGIHPLRCDYLQRMTACPAGFLY
jgi:hypothetical protein